MANIAISDVCPQASSFFTCSTGPAATWRRTLSGVFDCGLTGSAVEGDDLVGRLPG